jgi:U6 snRNA-associated Sm-like protein LSm4
MFQLPTTLLRGAIGSGLLVECKSGETFNGTLLDCDGFMNIKLKDVILTSKDGTQFWQMGEAIIRGNTIKYLRLSEGVLEKVKEESQQQFQANKSARGGRTNNERGRGRGGQGGQRGGFRQYTGERDNGERRNQQGQGQGQGRGGRGRGGQTSRGSHGKSSHSAFSAASEN